MERPVVLAMSPRVGRWNHRYFAPTRSGLTEEEAARRVNDAQDSSRPDPSIVHVEALVRQSSTGRKNREVLLVRDPRLSHCPNDVRQKIELILTKRLSDFGQFIESLPDEVKEKASGLLLHHDSFDKLSGAMLRELAPILDALPPVAEEEKPPTPHPAKRPPLSLWTWIILPAIIIAAALPVDWLALFGRRASPASSKEDTAFREFYFAVLGKGRGKEKVEEEFNGMTPEERIDKVRERLMEGDSEETPERSGLSAPTKSRLTPEEELRPLLVEYYKEKYGSEVSPPAELLGDRGFSDAMSEAFGKPEVDPTAFLDPKTDEPEALEGLKALRQFQCTGPRHFHDVLDALVALQEAAKNKEMAPNIDLLYSWEMEFIVKIRNYNKLELYKGDENILPLRTYRQLDAKNALKTAELLLPLFEETESAITTLREKLEKFTGKQEQDSSMRTALKKSDQNTQAAFQALKALGDVWLDRQGTDAASPPTNNTPR